MKNPHMLQYHLIIFGFVCFLSAFFIESTFGFALMIHLGVSSIIFNIIGIILVKLILKMNKKG